MNIDYRIENFHERTGSIQVRYFNTVLPDGVVFSINLPLTDGRYPQGDALDRLIRGYAPRDIFERAESIRLQAPAPPVGVNPSAVTDDCREEMLFGEGLMFIREAGERILITRPLIQLNALDIPVEVV